MKFYIFTFMRILEGNALEILEVVAGIRVHYLFEVQCIIQLFLTT